MSTTRYPIGHPKLKSAWAFYDWANSVYSLVISSAIFPIFYGALTIMKDDTTGEVLNDRVQWLGMDFNNDTLISYVTAAAFIAVAILSPLLSGIADATGGKKNFMRAFCYLGALSCMGLFFFNTDNLTLGFACYFLALVGFWGSLVFYNSYLPEIAEVEDQDALSARGFSMGYIGSVMLLIICLVLIEGYEIWGFSSKDLPTRLSFVLVGVWWIGFAQYTFSILPAGTAREGATRDGMLASGFRELRATHNTVQAIPQLNRYLVAFFVYSMAVQTVMLVATYFGVEEVNWGANGSTMGLIISILLIQLVAILGAWGTSKLAARFGNLPMLIAINVVWIGLCCAAFFVYTPNQFYATAAVVGLVMGGIQSLSRSTFSKMLPQDTKDTTSFFSFYDVSEKVGIVFGMIIYGTVAEFTGSMRYSVLILAAFFLVGVLLLLRVPRLQTKKAAQ